MDVLGRQGAGLSGSRNTESKHGTKYVISQVAKRIISWLPGVVLFVVIFVLGVARNRGKISHRVDELITDMWFLIIASLFVLVPRYEERKFFAKALPRKFKLEAGERFLFKWNLLEGVVYPNAGDWTPKVPFRVLFSKNKQFLGAPMLKVRLTDRRLAVGSISGYFWRIIPVSSIRRAIEFSGGFFNPPFVLLEYDFENHTEAVTLRTLFVGQSKFVALLRAVTPQAQWEARTSRVD